MHNSDLLTAGAMSLRAGEDAFRGLDIWSYVLTLAVSFWCYDFLLVRAFKIESVAARERLFSIAFCRPERHGEMLPPLTVKNY